MPEHGVLVRGCVKLGGNGHFCCVSNIFPSVSISNTDLKITKIAKYNRVHMNLLCFKCKCCHEQPCCAGSLLTWAFEAIASDLLGTAPYVCAVKKNQKKHNNDES